tara:strand:- start:3595 stop:4593 length:999 start_codon:yes stop_codon:yes gene_type:complete
MIIKSFEINKIKTENYNFFLIYGDNQGLKNDIIKDIKNKTKKEYKKFKYTEKELLESSENFFNLILTKSFFDPNKIIIIDDVTDKIFKTIESINKKSDVLIFILANKLDKKSKIRNLFEKDNELICIPCYEDNAISLNKIVNLEIKKSDIKISQESINLLIDRSSGDRQNLKNELEKIKSYAYKKKVINIDEVKILTNLNENFDNEEIINNCLAGNKKKLKKILEENNFSTEDYFILLKILSNKIQRLFRLKCLINSGSKVDEVFNQTKPAIFWKEKEIVRKQLSLWNINQLKTTINSLNKVELLCKKNNEMAVNIILNFISGVCLELNSAS